LIQTFGDDDVQGPPQPSHTFRPTCVALIRVLAILLALIPAPACRKSPDRSEAPQTSAAPQTQLRTELYFGLSKPDGGTVSAAEWDQFLARDVTPRFPEGLTVLDAAGQYQTQSGQLTREDTKLLILIHPAGPEKEKAIGDVIARYKELFRQESVLRVSAPAKVSF
jgi:hypothetical protein